MSAISSIPDYIEEPSTSIQLVTPVTAKRWLARNPKNRALKHQKTEQYRRDMIAGKWLLTGESIKFDTAGNLLDGQNRLMALAYSAVSVQMFVTRGLAPETQEVMDAGSPRSNADALNLRGHTHGKELSSVAITFNAWDTGFFKHAMTQQALGLSHSEVLAVVEEHPGLIESTRYVKTIRRTLPLPSGALGTAHYVLTGIDPDATADFFARVSDLRTRGKGDPVHTLLKRAGETREQRQRVWQSTALFFIFRAWHADRTGESLQKFQLGSPGRGWAQIPVPR